MRATGPLSIENLNKFVRAQHFKMENMNMLRDIPRKNVYITKGDLKDTYFMMLIVEKHQDLFYRSP